MLSSTRDITTPYPAVCFVRLEMLLAARLGWTRADRLLDLGAGPGQLALLAAPLVAEVVAIEPEPDMLAEAKRRARTLHANNVTFIAATSDALGALRASLGRFRTALMGQSFHWMLDKIVCWPT